MKFIHLLVSCFALILVWCDTIDAAKRKRRRKRRNPTRFPPAPAPDNCRVTSITKENCRNQNCGALTEWYNPCFNGDAKGGCYSRSNLGCSSYGCFYACIGSLSFDCVWISNQAQCINRPPATASPSFATISPTSKSPTRTPSNNPTPSSKSPSESSKSPSQSPTQQSSSPSKNPTQPSLSPSSFSPSRNPSAPSSSLSNNPSLNPTISPSQNPAVVE